MTAGVSAVAAAAAAQDPGSPRRLSATAFTDRLYPLSAEIKIPGATIRYSEAGGGEAVLLCHGIPLSMTTWQDLFFLLAEDHRVIAVDMPGYGRSSKGPGDYSLARIAGDMVELCSALNISRMHVVGSSFGAAVAITIALGYPSRVNRLVLINSVGIAGGTHKVERIVRSALVRHFAAGVLLQKRLGRSIFRSKLSASYATLEPDPALVDHYYALLRRDHGELSFLRTLEQFDEAALQRRLQHLANPVLSIWGGKDRVLPLSKSLGVQRLLPNCWSTVIAEAGHLPHEEMPEACASRIRSFLAMPAL
ncbi:alpha/beta fold hydrolase [Mesorhizobium sp. M0184]|uniref:alpha/beta fold hydrolase n=1 Tax=Mesorhizobium sp. M0184 TaxID=2956906 RepID=UPI00333B7CBC